jgi:hypothetical protein
MRRPLPTRTVLRYVLDEPATVTAVVTRAGRPVGTLTRRSATGPGRLTFRGHIGRRALAPGRYTMAVRATDAAGNRSATRTVRFRIG